MSGVMLGFACTIGVVHLNASRMRIAEGANGERPSEGVAAHS